MTPDTHNQFSPITIGLHWIIAITIICLLAIGIYMEENEVYALYPWHKSFGVLIFLFVLARIGWRIKNGWPTPAGQYSSIEHNLARLTHYGLIIGTALMPISGFLMSGLGGHGVEVFGIELMASNPDPNDPEKVVPYNEALAEMGHITHHWLGLLMIAMILLHVAGALKHHIVDKDGTLRRMLGGKL